MLSNILKLLEERDVERINLTSLAPELRASLSFIQSGCFAASIDDKTAFILKDSCAGGFRKTEDMLVEIECIKRQEFPSVRINFRLKDEAGKPQRFDCFFGIESDEEMELLKSLGEQDCFEIVFLDSEEIVFSKRVGLTEEDKQKIKAMAKEAAS